VTCEYGAATAALATSVVVVVVVVGMKENRATSVAHFA